MSTGTEGIVDITAQEAAAAAKEQARLDSQALADSVAKDRAAALVVGSRRSQEP
jgi:hypothetical protein